MWKMINFNINSNTLLIIALGIVIICLQMCKSEPIIDNGDRKITIDGKDYVVIKEKVDTIYKKIVQTKYVKGDTIFQYKPIFFEVPANVNMDSIVKDYYTARIYADTLHLKDSLGYVHVIDTVFNNKLKGRNWTANIREKIIERELVVKDVPRLQVFGGFNFGADKTGFNYVSGTLLFKDYKDVIYSVGLGYANPNNFNVQAGIYWKIKLKKK